LATFVLEEGLAGKVLEREARAMAQAAERAGVAIVGGDTKVAEHGKADGMYVTTAGLGEVGPGVQLGPKRVRPGDQVIVSGPLGDHGITILLARGELELEADLASDTRSVWPLVERLMATVPEGLRWLRDPTRGGLASALNELAREAGLGVALVEAAIPTREAVRGACELLGLDPLHVVNEGQFVAVVAAEAAQKALDALQQTPGGEEARIIGNIREDHPRTVVTRTAYGGSRVVDMLVGDPLPRIC
jgi:hydrogenase expression/formation protein HypE